MSFTSRFSNRADDYAASRPAYGDDALDFILEGFPSPLMVADLGAGTGISSRLLALRGAHVVAVEPNAAMSEKAEPYSGVHFLDGTGERTGLPSASVDIATAFQAFHWFATDAALSEIRRIVRPGGRAVLVLNERDERDTFTQAYGDLFRKYALDNTEARREASLRFFKRLQGTVAEREFPSAQTVDLAGLQSRTASSSYLPRDGASGEALRSDVAALFALFASDGTVRIALRTIVVRIDLRLVSAEFL
jgi:ubiquinone/menaquinone biosynthesis C-methylase UbiE